MYTLVFWRTAHPALRGPLTWRLPSRRSPACPVRESRDPLKYERGLVLQGGHASLSRGRYGRIRDGPRDAPTPPLLSRVLLTLADSIPHGEMGHVPCGRGRIEAIWSPPETLLGNEAKLENR